MRLPNGFGQISKIKSHNLRKPYRAMVTVGKTEFGKPICKPLQPEAYFKTYNDAYVALMKYNESPYDLSEKTTLKEIYESWSEHQKEEGIKPESFRCIRNAWDYCSSIENMNIREIRTKHIKQCIEHACIVEEDTTRYPTPIVKKRMKILIGQLFDYAIEYELASHNYAHDFTLSKTLDEQIAENHQPHIAFTNDEMKLLWNNVNIIPYVDMILIQCYSGWRPGELCILKIENVDLENGFFSGGLKTVNGKNRLVPIHSKIMPLVQKRYEEAVSNGSDYLFNSKYKSQGIHNATYRKDFNTVCKTLKLNPKHRAHDCRVQFVTMAKRYGVDEWAIKRIAGHAIKDITESVYTERSPEWLKSEIEKIQ